MNFVSDLTITSLDEIRGYDITTGDYLFTLDELQDATIANSEDRVDITGKNGRLLNTLKRNKSVTISGTNGLINSALMALQIGKDQESKTTTIDWVDDGLEVAASATTVATSYKAYGTAGSEIKAVYIKNSDGTLGAKLTQVASSPVKDTSFTYTAGTKTITFASAQFAAKTELVVFYKRQISGTVVTNKSDLYSKKCVLYIDATGEDKCGNEFRVQFYVPKADFNGTFDLALGGDQTVQAFEAVSLSGACGAADTFWTYTIFGANAADVT